MDNRSNTIAGWLLGAGIVALGASILTGEMFHAGRPEKMGYPIAGVSDKPHDGGEAEQPIANLLAAADPAKGQQVFQKCAACHAADKGAPNGTGPNIWGAMGGPIGKVAAGFPYSSALAGKGGHWDFESMNAWVKDPRAFAPGTKMTFAGLGKPEDRANLLAFLNTKADAPLPLPAPQAAPAAGANPAEAAAQNAAQPATPAPKQPVPTEQQGGAKIGGDAATSVAGRAEQTKH